MYYAVMDINPILTELLAAKDSALAASAANDGEFYRDYLAGDAVAVTPAGIATVDEIVAAASAGGFRSAGVSDVAAWTITDTVGAVRYRADYGPERPPVLVTTVYRRDADRWRGVLYQQTPLAG
jgi:uncharacterized protein DUF4440